MRHCGVVPVIVELYDPEWPRQFEGERAVLEQVLAPWLDGGIHHIGSTSIPGLAAKPTLDMLAGVGDLDRARSAIGPLAGIDYVHAYHRPRALWFYRPPPNKPAEHTHHLHLTEPGSDLWRERLGFRDALRAHPELTEKYQALKLRLAAVHRDDGAAYTREKRAFVARVLAGVGVSLPDPDPHK